MGELLEIEKREGLVIAILQARKAADRNRMSDLLGAEVPSRPGRRGNEQLAVIATGPDSWFLICSRGSGVTVADLSQRLSGLASVFDQSSTYVVYRVSGPGARTKLQSGCSVDISRPSFGVGSAVSTLIGYIGALFWQVAETPVFDIAINRSLERSFRSWLDDAVADRAI